MKKIIIITLVILMVLFSRAGCSSWARGMKSIQSDWGGGLNRTVTVYDYNGKSIQSWSGRFDISENDRRFSSTSTASELLSMAGL